MGSSKWHIEKFAATRGIVMKDGNPGTYIVFYRRGYWGYRFISELFSYSHPKRHQSMQSAIDCAEIDAKESAQ